MSSLATARLGAISPQCIEQATESELADWLAYFDPDALLLTGANSAPHAANILRRIMNPEHTLIDPLGNSPATGLHWINDVPVVLAPTPASLAHLQTLDTDEFDRTELVYVISGLLDLSVNTTTLSTTLEGFDEYRAALSPDELASEYIHIATRLPAHYRREWDGIPIVGGGVSAGDNGTPLIALDCRSDGRLLTRSLNPSRLGLRALDGVGTTRAHQLRDAGFTGREAVANADTASLIEIDGFGLATVERMQRSARAIAHGEVVRVSDDPLPTGDPVYIDIETDGLTPTITWLIGVLDGPSDGDGYLSFIQTDPDEPGRAIEDFMAWYTANANHRPLVAYSGWRFDFHVLYEHIIEYCPYYEDEWTNTYRFDPYRWAVTDGNAILPGRTNQLEDVANALGYERTETGLTGEAVARAYQQWMIDQAPEAEPDWAQFKAYCEDDVRALAMVYEAVQESTRIVSTNDPRRDPEKTTTQGSLTDW